MDIMKTTAHYSQVLQTEKPMDTFPKPRTIPDGWDLSEMLTAHYAEGSQPENKMGFKSTAPSESESENLNATEAGFEDPTDPNTP
jgi:hypothetical protein